MKNSIPAIYARYIRLYPLKWYVRGCARIELYGEPWLEGNVKIKHLFSLKISSITSENNIVFVGAQGSVLSQMPSDTVFKSNFMAFFSSANYNIYFPGFR